jgi:hypothetical protein
MLTNTLVFLSTGDEAEGSEVPSAVPVEDMAPETQEAVVEASEPMEVVAGEAAATTGGPTCEVPEARHRHAVKAGYHLRQVQNDIQEMQAKGDDAEEQVAPLKDQMATREVGVNRSR